MRFIRQFGVILGVTFLGELCKLFIPLSVPASIYGLIFMLFFLCRGWIKVEQVEECGDFLVEIMPLMFIPAGVGLIDSIDVLKPILFPLIVITLVTTFFVMIVTGHVAQFILEGKNKRKEERRK